MGQNQNIQRMVGEINKLITNELLTHGGIYLPNIGSLRVEVCESSPRRTVKYHEAEIDGFISLIGVIALKTKCSVAQATKLYEQWYEAVKQTRQVEIEGIGTVRGGRFEVSSDIERRLTPAIVEPKVERAQNTIQSSDEPMEQSQGRGRGVKILMLSLSAAVIIAAICMVPTCSIGDSTVIIEQEIEQQIATEPEPVVEPIAEAEAEEAEAVAAEAVVEPIAEPITTQKEERKGEKRELITRTAKTTSNSEAINLLRETLAQSNERTSTKYKVAYGVYSSQANAGRAIIDAMEQDHDTTRTKIGVTLRDGKYMVTLFESDHFYTSVSYMKRNDEYFDNALWVYDPEKM